jgi:hypothetical protein
MAVSPQLVLEACAQARARLFAAAEYEDLGEAITPLLVHAHTSGLDEQLGAEAVLDIIRKAFEGVAEI